MGHEGNKARSPAPRWQTKRDSFAEQYVAQLRQVYRAPPPTWDPLPQCKHIRLAMIKGRERDLPTITLRKWAKDELKAFGAVALFTCMTCVYVKMIHDHCTPCLASSS